MKVYSEKTQDFFPTQIIWFGWAFVAGSLVIAYTNWVIGALFGSLSLLVVSGREGLMIDFRKKKLKYYWGVLGLKFGKFEDLPAFGRLTVSPKINLIRGKKMASKRKFELRLWYKDVQDFTLAFTGKHADCIEKGRFLSKNLRIPMADLSKSNGSAPNKKGPLLAKRP